MSERKTLKSAIYLFMVVCLLLPGPVAASSEKREHQVLMFKNADGRQPATVFSPRDEIVVYVNFIGLPEGDHAFQAEWYNAFGELQDASRFAFSLAEPGDFAVESTLEMKKAGFLNRLFSVSETTGYSVKFYGKWQVKIFLNGEEVASQDFEVR